MTVAATRSLRRSVDMRLTGHSQGQDLSFEIQDKDKFEEIQSDMFDGCLKHDVEIENIKERIGKIERTFHQLPKSATRGRITQQAGHYPLGQKILQVVQELELTRKDYNQISRQLKQELTSKLDYAQDVQMMRDMIATEMNQLYGGVWQNQGFADRNQHPATAFEHQLSALRYEMTELVKSTHIERDRLLQGLTKANEKAAHLIAGISATKRNLTRDVEGSLSVHLLSTADLQKHDSESRSHGPEDIVKANCTNVLKDNEAFHGACQDVHSLNIHFMNTVVALERERLERAKSELRFRELQELHKIERQKMMSLFDEERQQLAHAAMSRIEKELSKQALHEAWMSEVQTRNELLEDETRHLRKELGKLEAVKTELEDNTSIGKGLDSCSSTQEPVAVSHENIKALLVRLMRERKAPDNNIQSCDAKRKTGVISGPKTMI